MYVSDLAFILCACISTSCNQVSCQTLSLVTMWGGGFTDYVIMSYVTS